MSESPLFASAAFPFTAVVGHEDLKRALLLNVVDPRIGGVLIRGDRGTAKSTIVRGLAAILPAIETREGCSVACDPSAGPCAICGDRGTIIERPQRVVDLPLGATEDRVVGSIDLARALTAGERRFEPGLVGAAHRGVLYVDEVNLLPDHLVDLLLDVAASGTNVVERDGTSASHPARFILVGTMNPEEGDLRPQLLDRFGLVVDVHTSEDPEVRAEVVRRRIAFDTDPGALLDRFAGEEQRTRDALTVARASLSTVRVPPAMLQLIVTLCIEARADGMRADITIHRAATALAALDARTEVTRADVVDAARLVLPHRQHPPRPGMPPPPDLSSILGKHEHPEHDDDAERGEGAQPPPPPTDGDDAPASTPNDQRSQPGSEGEGDSTDTRRSPASNEQIAVPLPPPPRGGGGGRHRALPRTAVSSTRGRTAGTCAWDHESRDIALVASAVEAVRSGVRTGDRVTTDHLRMHRRDQPPGRLVLLLIDGSGSMGAQERMARTKAALRSIIERVYLRRDCIAVQVFRGGRADLLVAAGRSIASARAAIEELPTGGGTPIAAALHGAAEVLRRAQRERPGEASLLILVTDGRTREPLADAVREVAALATTSMVLDTESGPTRLGRARRIAHLLDATYEALP